MGSSPCSNNPTSWIEELGLCYIDYYFYSLVSLFASNHVFVLYFYLRFGHPLILAFEGARWKLEGIFEGKYETFEKIQLQDLLDLYTVKRLSAMLGF